MCQLIMTICVTFAPQLTREETLARRWMPCLGRSAPSGREEARVPAFIQTVVLAMEIYHSTTYTSRSTLWRSGIETSARL